MANNIIVCQIGARHRYLIPQALHRHGMLHRLYTDSTRWSMIGRIACLLGKLHVTSRNLARLCKRDPRLPLKKLFTTDTFFFRLKRADLRHKGDSLHKRELYFRGFADKCRQWGVDDADCIYNMYIENYDFLVYAKSKGLKVVVDIYETPTTYRHLIEEIHTNPEYALFESKIDSYAYSNALREEYMEKVLALADAYTIPSKFVAKSMTEYKNYDPAKMIFLPYGSSITTDAYGYQPRRHRLIWVGNDPVRKGLLYCAKAVDILKERYPDIDFRVIGDVGTDIQQAAAFSSLHFLGVLNKEQLMDEYRSAEAYVFPTLFEGFAGTVIEAASCGCPIITTECAGTDTDTFPAIYIPTKDVNAIVESVTEIFENPEKRDTLSQKVFDYAKNLAPETYEKNLVAALKSV